MAADCPLTGPVAAISNLGLPVSILPGKDGLVLSDDSTILMMYGYGGVVVADLADAPEGDVPRAFR